MESRIRGRKVNDTSSLDLDTNFPGVSIVYHHSFGALLLVDSVDLIDMWHGTQRALAKHFCRHGSFRDLG